MEPIFDPHYISLEYFFGKILELGRAIYNFVLSEFFIIIFFILGGLFVFIIIYSILRLLEIWKKDEEEFRKVPVTKPVSVPTKTNKWREVLKHLQSENPANWHLAIIEADTILDEMVQEMGYRGENLGERLKQVKRSNFSTLDTAWEAHKVRNRIAHEGTRFKLSREQARRVIGQYETVFREFNYI